MAFICKVGNILKQNASKHMNARFSAPNNPSLFQVLRSMSSLKIFIGGLAYGTDDTSLKEAFTAYGEVIESKVIVDYETGRSRGFGFVSFTSSEEASSAVRAMDGQDLHGRRIRVNYATERGGGFRNDGEYANGGYGGGGSSSSYGNGGNGGAYGGSYEGGNYGGSGHQVADDSVAGGDSSFASGGSSSHDNGGACDSTAGAGYRGSSSGGNLSR